MAKTAPTPDPVAAPAADAPAEAVAPAPAEPVVAPAEAVAPAPAEPVVVPAEAVAAERFPMLRITARVNGFRRAGMAHAATPTLWPVGIFTAEQVAALLAEPNLIVERFDAPTLPEA